MMPHALRYISILLFAMAFARSPAQDRDIRFSGEFSNTSFNDFVTGVEGRTGARFYYRSEWVSGLTVNAGGDSLSLSDVLAETLRGTDLHFLIDGEGRIYITPVAIRAGLPAYEQEGDAGSGRELTPGSGEMTNTEQRYIEGRKAGLRETIVIGGDAPSSRQTGGIVYGKITDRETGEPLIGATVFIEEMKKGAATDIDGRYSMALAPGRYTVDFNCLGMEAREIFLDVRTGGQLDIAMDKSLIPISEVVIEANRYHNVKGTQMGFERLNYKTVKEIPVVMGENDLMKVAQMLPGVQSVGEGTSGFNVRGSGADQNMIYVNKVPVYNSSHLFGFFSSFSQDIIKDFSLYKSNLPVKFGGRLASFLDISTRQGNMNKFSAHGGISPITGHVAVEGPVIRQKSAYVLSARSTYSDWILRRLSDPDLRNSDAMFYDLAGSYTYEPDGNNLVKTFGYYSSDRFSLGSTNSYAYTNAGASVNFRHRFSSNMSGEFAAVYGEYSFEATDRSVESYAYRQQYRINHTELRGDFTWLTLGSHKLNYGAGIIWYGLDRGRVDPYGGESLRKPVILGRENGLESALYLGDEISLTTGLTLSAGIRLPFYFYMGPGDVRKFAEGKPKLERNIVDTLHFGAGQVIRGYTGPEPRLALHYLIDEENSVKLSYNRVRQFLFLLSNTIAISPTDQWKLCDYNILPPFADQVTAGYYHDFSASGINTSLEVYHKWISNVVEYRDGASFIDNPEIELDILQGNQKTYGVEAMIRKNTGKLNGWISYSYSRSFMHVAGDDPLEEINGGLPYPSNFDRPHSLNLVSNYKVNRRLSFSANLVYLTGRPVTYPVALYYTDGIEHIHYSERNKYRIPDYFRMDVSINLEGNLRRKKPMHSYWMLNVYNLTGRRNAYSVFFRNEGGRIEAYKLSVFGQPVVTLSWNFKLGNYASE